MKKRGLSVFAILIGIFLASVVIAADDPRRAYESYLEKLQGFSESRDFAPYVSKALLAKMAALDEMPDDKRAFILGLMKNMPEGLAFRSATVDGNTATLYYHIDNIHYLRQDNPPAAAGTRTVKMVKEGGSWRFESEEDKAD